MYDRRLPEPRLTAWWDTASAAIEGLPILTVARTALSHHTPDRSTRSASTSTATGTTRWPGTAIASDTSSRTRRSPSSAPASRARSTFVREGCPSLSWQLGHGDLFVMGGSCQHDWEHCVPKVAVAGPRLSIMFRHNLAAGGVRD
jgi:hypothetical protein